MKIRKLFLGALISISMAGLSTADEQGNRGIGIGGENSQHQVEISQEIKNLIEQIKHAPPQERYRYMNQLKIKIRELNQQERVKIVNQLREELHNRTTERAEHNMERMHNNMEHSQESHQERQHNFMNRNDEMQNRFIGNEEHENRRYHGRNMNNPEYFNNNQPDTEHTPGNRPGMNNPEHFNNNQPNNTPPNGNLDNSQHFNNEPNTGHEFNIPENRPNTIDGSRNYQNNNERRGR